MLPGGDDATICYGGPYSGIAGDIAALQGHLQKQGLRSAGELVELYHVDVHDTLYPAEYLSELHQRVDIPQ